MYIFTYNNICAIISYPRELNKHTVIPANTETYQWATVDSADNPAPSKKKKKESYRLRRAQWNFQHYSLLRVKMGLKLPLRCRHKT